MAHRARVPILEIIILLVIALIVFFPVINKILPSAPSLPFLRPRAAQKNTRVWVNLHSGLYYCTGSHFYGRQKPGKFMTVQDARQRGFSAAQQKEPCP